MKKRKEIVIVVFFAALMCRLVFYALIRDTPFLWYHLVPGLDMQTLLRFSEWGAGGSGIAPFFTAHRFLLFLIWKCCGGHQVLLLFFIQALTGALGAAALADLSLMLTGKRKTSLLAGVVFAAALPVLLYEFSVLQECFVLNFFLFAIWASFAARKRRFPVKRSLAAGILWALALAGRPTVILAAGAGILLLLREFRRKKEQRKGILLLLLAAAGVLIGASLFNGKIGPFYHVFPYTIEYNAQADAAQGKKVSPGLLHSAGKAVTRVPRLFSPRELPENQNLYFWRHKLNFLYLFPGPGGLLAFSLAGMLLLLAGKARRKALFPLGVIALLALPLCAREPIGRYRLMLWPWLILLGSFGFGSCRTISPRWNKAAYLAAGIAAFFTLRFGWSVRNELRLSDYHAWALAVEGRYGHGEESLEAFSELWEKSGHAADSAFRAYVWEAFCCEKPALIRQAIAEAKETGKVEPNLIAYYTGALYVLANDAPRVKAIFTRIDVKKLPPDLQESVPEILKETERILRQEK